MKKKDKVYCGQCEYFDNEYCDVNPEKRDTSYIAPNSHSFARAICALKNQKNDCPDFKKKK